MLIHHTRAPRVIGREYHVSGKGVLGGVTLPSENPSLSIVVGQDNENSSPIVNVETKSRTFCPNKRGVNNYSVLDNGLHGHIHNARNDLHNGFEALMNVKNNGQQQSSVETNNPENNSESGFLNGGVSHTACHQSSLKPNVCSACQGVVTSDNMCHNVLLYDVNVGTCDDNVE